MQTRSCVGIGVLSCVVLFACGGDDGTPAKSVAGTEAAEAAERGGVPARDPAPASPAPPAAEADAGADSSAPAAKPLVKSAEGPCAKGTECESGVCFVGGTQSYCSLACTVENAATVCASPFTGACNKQGYCRRD